MQGALVLVLGLAMLNGLFSPALLVFVALSGLWYPWFLPASAGLLFFFASLMVATFTLMIAGVPAAVYERLSRASQPTVVSMGIWLLGILVLTAPAVANILAAIAR